MEGQIDISEADSQAVEAWNLLANGTGGIDWNGLPYVVAHLGIEDVKTLVQRLLVIKTHKPADLKRPNGISDS